MAPVTSMALLLCTHASDRQQQQQCYAGTPALFHRKQQTKVPMIDEAVC
jgi:hypothetical protein